MTGRAQGWRWGAAALAVTLALACAPAPGRGEAAPAETAAQSRPDEIEIRPILPATDSVGSAPSRFAWTPVKGADHYSIAVYNDVDRMLWQNEDVRDASVPKPAELELPAGTYFWRVAAIGGDKLLADSGWSAFVVRTE